MTSKQKRTTIAIHAGFKVNPESLTEIQEFLFSLKKKDSEEFLIPEKTRKYWRQESYFACIHIDGEYGGKINSTHVEDWYKKWSTWYTTNPSQAILRNLYIKNETGVIAVSITISGQHFYLILGTNGSTSLQSIKGQLSSGKIQPIDLSSQTKITFNVEPYITRN
jgi:hypothetical protein